MALVSAGASLGGFAGGSVLSRLLVVVSGDTRPLTQALRTAQADVLTFSQKAGMLGSSLTRSLSLPALAIAGSLTFMNAQFQKSLATIAALTPVVQNGEETMESLSEKILNLARTLPTAPNEIARSFYFAASAGLSATEAFQVVTLSAKAAALGMGEAADVSRVLIAGLNNYRDTGLTAASAMDALTAAIREGTAEPDELAISLGRLLPIAEQAGVTFQEVVGSVAALTNLGVPARVATTSLRALFSQLLAPTIQATQTLDALGLSAQDVRDALETGPIEAFQLLWTAAKGNEDVIRNLIPQIRGLTAYYGATGDQLDSYRHILDETTNSQGDFARAFQELEKTPAFKFEVAVNKLRIAAIELGQKAIPIFEKLINVLGNVGEILSSMPGWAKSTTVGLLILAGVAGPMLKLVSAMTEVRKATLLAGAAGTSMVMTGRALTTSFLTLGLSTVLAIGSLASLANGATDLVTSLSAVIFSVAAARTAILLLQAAANVGLLRVTAFSVGLASLSGAAATAIAVGIGVIAAAIAYMAGESGRAEQAVKKLKEEMTTAVTAGDSLRQAFKAITDTEIAQRMRDLANSVGILDRNAADSIDTFGKALSGEFLGQLDSMLTALDNSDVSGIFADSAQALRGVFVPAVIEATRTGRSLDHVLEGTGYTVADFDRILSRLGSTRAPQNIRDLASDSQELLEVFRSTLAISRELAASAESKIGAYNAEQTAIQQLASQTGASVDFIEGELNKMGVTATEVVGGEYVEQFALAAGGTEKFSLAARESARQVQAAWGELSSSLAESFTVLGDLPEKANKSLESYLNRAQELSRIAVQQTQDINALQQAGVPAGLIDQLIAEGPAMVAKFASGTKGQLDSLIAAYQVGLAAVDAEILKEGKHQEEKGRGMVQGFANSILNSRRLTTSAAQQLMISIGSEISKGNISTYGAQLITEFVDGMNKGPKLSADQARAVITAFANELSKPKNFDGYGNLMVRQVVNGIAAEVDLPRQRIATMIDNALNNVVQKEPKAERSGQGLAMAAARGMESVPFVSIGQSYGAQLAEGMIASTWMVEAAAVEVANRLKSAFTTALQGSPKYASFYMGQKWNEEFNRGMKGTGLTNSRPVPMMGPGTGGRDGGDETTRLAQAIARGLGEGMGDVVVSIDGHEVARAITRNERVRTS